MNASDATEILGYFCRLAAAPERPATASVLQELARLFDAAAIGLGTPNDGRLDLVFPATAAPISWNADGELVKKIQASLTAESYVDDAGAWLVSAVERPGGGEAWLVWLYRPTPHEHAETGGAVAWEGEAPAEPASPARQEPRPPKIQPWSESERWQWMSASQALVRWLELPNRDTVALRKRLELAATVTGRLVHDFGNYLTGILGFTELSLKQAAADTQQRLFLQEVLQSAQQGAAWIHRLQLFCRRSAGPFWPTALSSVLTLEAARARSSEMRWHADVPRDLPLLAIDAEALQLALQEVVNNAREATKNQGTIRVTARATELTDADCRGLLGAAEAGAHVELAIADDGPGIAAAEHAKLFHELFYSTKPRQRGVGFLVVHGILQRYRAGFRLDAAEPGRGLCVRFYLPTAALESLALADGAKRPHVLLVHANPVIFDSLRVILEMSGCQVSEANSGPMALAVCRMPRASFALILIDLTLPNVPGLELARRILEQQAKANFLFLHTQTAFHGLTEEELLKRFPLLRWPLQPAALLAAVRTALERGQP